MKASFLLFAFIFTTSILFGQFTTEKRVDYSKHVEDSFEIYISVPSTFNLTDTFNVVYYCDANLKLGKQLRKLLSSTELSNNLTNIIFVGIGHIGNFHVLRRRDFILPTIKEGDTSGANKYYGQIEKFYNYLKEELIPSINSKFKIKSNSIIGHSLSGLFIIYCLFKADNLFAKYFALSPSLWIDNYSIYKFNKVHEGFLDKQFLYFVAGSKETLNRILDGTNELKTFLDIAQYKNLNYEYEILNGETHNSEVPLSLEKILKQKL